jgi:hypothetical protein
MWLVFYWLARLANSELADMALGAQRSARRVTFLMVMRPSPGRLGGL